MTLYTIATPVLLSADDMRNRSWRCQMRFEGSGGGDTPLAVVARNEELDNRSQEHPRHRSLAAKKERKKWVRKTVAASSTVHLSARSNLVGSRRNRP
jgi:hypothetical protein